MIFKCKICGGSLDVRQGEKVTVCEYCGVRQSIPTFIEPKIEEIYNRANNYLMHNEFDKAENLYNQILFENKEDADAYWNVLMCRYGVTYVKDPASGKYIPTCNRTLYAPIFNDENYKKAIKYADDEQKALFEANAKTIDDIQKGILSVSRKEKPFDIFISYKETDVNGARTKDSIIAQDLYDKLTAEGYKVFFSRITLEDKVGTEYEPYIYAALASSKVMITVSSSKENIESVWVKNEWSRFLSFAGKDSSKTLIPLYFDMEKEELPDDFAHLSTYDMKVDGFEQELIRGIKKLIPLPVMLLERRRKFRKKMKFVGLGAIAIAIIAVIVSIPWFAKLPEYNAAMQLYYDKNYPEATWAFDKLGGYRDSDKMKEKCELSWRKSLATVSVDSFINRYSNEKYCITPNGIVECLEEGFGTEANSAITINEHGKPVSISDGTLPDGMVSTNLYVLYEDGYVLNAVENNKLEHSSEWHNIVQISPVFQNTNIALRADGKLLHGNNKTEQYSDVWLEEVSEWENIVKFDYYFVRGGGTVDNAAIIGIKSDGTLCAVLGDSFDENTKKQFKQILSQFKDVKEIDFYIERDYKNKSNNYCINVAAITNHGSIAIFTNGSFTEYDAENVIDISVEYDVPSWDMVITHLTSDGTVLIKDSNKVVLEDVVAMQDYFYITRSGSIYDYEVEKYNVKSVIYDEWIERLK